jgi:hypothetical protein
VVTAKAKACQTVKQAVVKLGAGAVYELHLINRLVIPTLSGAEGEGSAVRRKMQIPRFARDDKSKNI